MNIDAMQDELDKILKLESSYKEFKNDQDGIDRLISIVAAWLEKKDLPVNIDILKKHVCFDD